MWTRPCGELRPSEQAGQKSAAPSTHVRLPAYSPAFSPATYSRHGSITHGSHHRHSGSSAMCWMQDGCANVVVVVSMTLTRTILMCWRRAQHCWWQTLLRL